MARQFWVETLGCPKNRVDSDKLAGTLLADGMQPAEGPADADVVVVNTCAFIDEARQESIDTILALDDTRKSGSRLVVTGCMAERYESELAAELPTAEVARFGVPVVGPDRPAHGAGPSSTAVPVVLRSRPHGGPRPPAATGAVDVVDRGGSATSVPSLDLLELPRPPASAPWAYVKIAEGCDRACGFCAIPTFRGPQRSRPVDAILAEVDQLGAAEVVLVAQDLAAYGRDQGVGERRLVPLVRAVAERVERVRLLYLYPSDLTDELIETIVGTGVPYFDLSLQHVARPLLRRMRRWGDGTVFTERIARIRALAPTAAFRSNFIVGYPGETEDDHDQLLEFVTATRLDWCGFFAYSQEEGTYAADLDGKVPPALVGERLHELRELQDRITTERRDELIGTEMTVLVDAPGVGRSHREAPEIDGIVEVPHDLAVGELHTVRAIGAIGPDLRATAVEPEVAR